MPEPEGDAGFSDWQYLIAHHLPDRYDRTLTLRIRRQSYHFCARCTGELFGFIAMVTAFLGIPPFGNLVSTPMAGLLLGLCPSPALVDWLTQTVGSRDSNNLLRVASGALLGVSAGGLIAYGVTHRWLFLGSGVAVLGSYLTVAVVVLYRTGAWRKVVAAHFP